MRVLPNVSINANSRLALSAAICAAVVCAQANLVHAAAINVALANHSTTTTTTNANNSTIDPVTYTPMHVTIPVAPGQTYDAADTTDTGTTWNSLQSVSTVPATNTSGANVNVLYQQNLPLVDSSGAITAATLNVSEILPNNKGDAIHTGQQTAAGTDGLVPNPGSTAAGTGANNGWGTSGSAQQELMGNEFIANGSAEGMIFTLDGLTAGTYNVFVYGGGTTDGQGATFTLDPSNVPAGGTAAVATNSDTSNLYHSVFDSSGTNPTPEKGLSWNMLTATVGASGILTFSATASETTGAVKPAVNGFQIDAVAGVATPEPASLGVLAIGGLALLARRRKA
jgi:hypothetical protein